MMEELPTAEDAGQEEEPEDGWDREDLRDALIGRGSVIAGEFAEAFETFLEKFATEIARRTEVVEVRTYNRHVLTRYADGRIRVLSPRRWLYDREPPPAPTPFELLQLGQDIRKLCPEHRSWMNAAMGIGFAGIAAIGLFGGWFGKGKRR